MKPVIYIIDYLEEINNKMEDVKEMISNKLEEPLPIIFNSRLETIQRQIRDLIKDLNFYLNTGDKNEN